MPAQQNVLKQKLHSLSRNTSETDGPVQFGCWLGLADAYATEITATAGFDWLVIDGEHAPNDLRSIMAQLQIVSASNSEPIVRLPVGDSTLIKQALDIGAQSLLIPMVESAQQAEELVRATRYPPQGIRGVGSALARASRFNADQDYLQTANNEICLIVQLESKAAIDALDDILEVEGIDGVFIGPADLAADLGYLGEADTERMFDLTNDLLRRIAAGGKAAGILALSQESIAQAMSSGAHMIGVGIDVLLLANSARALAANPSMS